MDPIAITALCGTMSTFIGAVFGYLSLLAKNKVQDKDIESLKKEMLHVTIEHKKCEEDRSKLHEEMNTDWPSDATNIVTAMSALKANGLPCTVREVSMILRRLKLSQMKKIANSTLPLSAGLPNPPETAKEERTRKEKQSD